MGILTQEEVMSYATQAGFVGDALLHITAICYVESGFDPLITNSTGNTPPSFDRGLVQINDYWHNEISDACAFDPLCALQAAYTISKQGTDFSAWTTYTTGKTEDYYRRLLSMSEVIVTVPVTQFEMEPSTHIMETEYACGQFAGATLKYAVQPGHTCTATPEQIDQTADAYYTKYIGPNLVSNVNGTSIDVMHAMIQDNGQRYQDVNSITPTSQHADDIAHIKAALAQGYPLVATVDETSVFDLDLGRNPYAWGPSGTHIVLYTGIAPDGNLLVHDTANIVGPLMVNNTIMPQPRRYDITKIATHWATMVHMPWLPAIPACYDPTSGPIQKEQPPVTNTPTSNIPNGWQQRNGVLSNPWNGYVVRAGFEQHILNSPDWGAWNVPLENEVYLEHVEYGNLGLGPGTRQIFNGRMLIWLKNENKVEESWIGQELKHALLVAKLP